MKRVIISAIVALYGFVSQAAVVNEQRNIDFEGRVRRYILYVPDGIGADAPLVVSLHGAAGHDTDRSPFRTSVADAAKCIVVYPQGENQNFGPFGIVPGWNATGRYNEDARFLKAVIDDVAATRSIDRNRIYCCGFSNGGMMTYASSTACADIFAAFASISGFQLNEFHHSVTGTRPVPFLHIHGKSDDFVKYSLMPVIRDAMVARNGCNPVPEVTAVSGRYTKSVYTPLADNESFPYEYIEVNGMGHNDYTSNTPDNNSSLTMWRFFNRFTLTDSCDRSLKWRISLDVDGFNPAEHGWTVNATRTRFEYGTSPRPNNGDNNVYHSLQFEPGHYALTAHVQGNDSALFYVKIETLAGEQLLSKACNVGRDVVIPFTVDSFGHYRVIIVKSDATIVAEHMDVRSVTQPAEPVNCTDAPLPPEQDATGTLIEIPQSQGTQYDDFARTAVQQCDGYTLYTATGDLQIAFKMLNVDVADCDYLLIKFKEPVNAGWKVAFYEGTSLEDVASGSAQVRFDLTPSMRAAGIAPQICMMTFFGTQTPLTAKVEGVYKHNIAQPGAGLIDITDSSISDDVWYDLHGYPHSVPTSPGIYIHNGRKSIVK